MMSVQTMGKFNEGRPGAIWKSLKTAEETKISITNTDNSNHISHKLLHLLQNNCSGKAMKDTDIVYTCISYEDIVKELHSRKSCKDNGESSPSGILESLESIWAGQYVPKKKR